jgi:hypothetical protein
MMKGYCGLWAILVAMAGCAGDQAGDGRDPFLTSNAGVERLLTIKGYVYVDQGADASTVDGSLNPSKSDSRQEVARRAELR